MDVPAHIKQYWRHKWHLSPAQIKALEARFVEDWRWRETNGQEPEPLEPKPPALGKQPYKIERAREIIELNQTMSLTEIAAQYGMTPQRISQIFKRAGVKPMRHPHKRGSNV